MFRATTPLHKFIFDQDAELFDEILITYAQNGKIVLEKRKDDLTFGQDENGHYTASVKLTQEESNLFRYGSVNIQVRVLTADGEALSSEVRTLAVKDVLNDEVLE